MKYGVKQDLANRALSYHEYFAAVYHNEKIGILTKQINLLSAITHLLQ